MEEMLNLIYMLNKEQMDYIMKKRCGGYQIVLLNKTRTKALDDAIWLPGSRGYEHGLLETFKAKDCQGYETAEDVIKVWKQYLNDDN